MNNLTKAQEFVDYFISKYRLLIIRIGRRYLIPNRYEVDDIKQYISERIMQIYLNRLEEGSKSIEDPEKYFRACIQFYCTEFQRMHGFIFNLPKRPRKNCVEDEKDAKAWGFKYLGDLTIDEYNSIYQNGIEKDLTETQAEPINSKVWDTLTGLLTKNEADVIECIFLKKMTWAETSEHLSVAQSTCWFRKNRAIQKIYSAVEGMEGLVAENLKSLVRNNESKLKELNKWKKENS